eukprot:3827587-Prymnesium_polylepis.1
MSVSGPCVVTTNNNCVQSSSYGQGGVGYAGSESCRIDYPRADPIHVVAWDVEAGASCNFDFMIINGQAYCGTTGPEG